MSLDIKVLGRLVRDPVERSANNAKFASFIFCTDAGATDNTGKRKPFFLQVSAWGRYGETIMQYCKKGTQLLITASAYDNTTYTNKNGEVVANLSVTLEKFEFVKNKEYSS